jgi:soluble lytic murein transglycosylase
MAFGGAAESQAEAAPDTRALAYAPAAPATAADIEVLKEGLRFARTGKSEAAGERKAQVRDTAAQKLIEWALLRSDNNEASFARYAAFLQANPHWPSTGMLRRRAEAQLWQEKREPGTVFAFFSKQAPLSAKGKFAYARALLAQGDRANAQAYVRDAWRHDSFGADFESQIIETYGELISREDHRARMHKRFYAEDTDSGLRWGQKLGGADLAVARARAAVINKSENAGALLEAVPNEARSDPGYVFSRVQWLRRNDRIGEAAQLMLNAPNDPNVILNPDEWWVERRLVARKLLDADNPKPAYRITRDAAQPDKSVYKTEHQFTAGWIALRFLEDSAAAQQHFSAILQETQHPMAVARARYWLGRTMEAAGRSGEARQHYDSASRHGTTYYGQLARARLGQSEHDLRRPPHLSETHRAALRNIDLVRAVELLYATSNRDLVIPFVAELAEKFSDANALTMIGEAAARHDDARAMLFLGKSALGRGLGFDHFAFPNIGMPKFASIGPEVDRSVIYAIARQESTFNQKIVSTANAMGLMQVTPAAGKHAAKKYGITYNQKKLLEDPVYNTQVGAAEIGELVQLYDGNYVLAFAAYNAGRGRVKEWIERYGDPRKGDIDPIDWVERIPFSETRNYVQRVMENYQVYRARFGGRAPLTIEADMRGSRPQ